MSKNNVPTEQTPPPGPSIGVKDAVRRAAEYVQELYSYTDTQLLNLRLEEVDLSEDGSQWLITFGFTPSEVDTKSTSILGSLGGAAVQTRREYKVIAIDSRTGEPLSMKIREL